MCREDEKGKTLEEQKLHHENAEAGYNSKLEARKQQDKEAASKSWKGKTRTLGQCTTSKDAVDMITSDFQKNFKNSKLVPQRHLLLKTAVNIQCWNTQLCSDTGLLIFMG